MTPPRAILFDWDNTLVESWGTLHEALRQTFVALELPPWSFRQTKAWVRRSMRDSFQELFGDRSDLAHTLFYDHYRKIHLARLKPVHGVRETLAALTARGVYAGVVSSKRGTLVRAEADRLGWSGFFGRVVGAEDAVADKPAPAAIALALAGSGIEAGPDVWYVGDTGIDVVCARNASCKAMVIGVGPPHDGESRMTADHQFCDFEAFRGFLRQNRMTI